MTEIVERFTRDNGYLFILYVDLTQIEHIEDIESKIDDIEAEYVCQLLDPTHNFGVCIRGNYWYKSPGCDGVNWYLYFFLIDSDGPEEFSSPDILGQKDLCGKTSDELYEFCKERLDWHMKYLR